MQPGIHVPPLQYLQTFAIDFRVIYQTCLRKTDIKSKTLL